MNRRSSVRVFADPAGRRRTIVVAVGTSVLLALIAWLAVIVVGFSAAVSFAAGN